VLLPLRPLSTVQTKPCAPGSQFSCNRKWPVSRMQGVSKMDKVLSEPVPKKSITWPHKRMDASILYLLSASVSKQLMTRPRPSVRASYSSMPPPLSPPAHPWRRSSTVCTPPGAFLTCRSHVLRCQEAGVLFVAFFWGHTHFRGSGFKVCVSK
jgi:hypothetical protein